MVLSKPVHRMLVVQPHKVFALKITVVVGISFGVIGLGTVVNAAR